MSTAEQGLIEPDDSLAGLIARLGANVAAWDRSFARQLAIALSAEAERLVITPIERLALRDVVVTFSLGDRLSVVVTGQLPDVPGDLTLRWQEQDLPQIAASFSEHPREPYLVCSLDFGPAGRHGILRAGAGHIPAGQVVRVRARATVGGRHEWRVQGLGQTATIPLQDLRLLDE
ncbi:MAG: hypothetical protein KC502_02480 [Myxococcales bacterium]|nr:hypothetical protein [Myxococcales bacterium]